VKISNETWSSSAPSSKIRPTTRRNSGRCASEVLAGRRRRHRPQTLNAGETAAFHLAPGAAADQVLARDAGEARVQRRACRAAPTDANLALRAARQPRSLQAKAATERLIRSSFLLRRRLCLPLFFGGPLCGAECAAAAFCARAVFFLASRRSCMCRSPFAFPQANTVMAVGSHLGMRYRTSRQKSHRI
jgi:hypothetical protein